MAIYHFNVSIVGRSAGHNLLAKSAYVSAGKRSNEELQQQSDFSRKRDVIHSEVMLPDHAPKEFLDADTLWNSLLQVEKEDNAQLARRGDFAIPAELSLDEGIELGKRFIKDVLVAEGMCVEFGFHNEPGNPHIDFLATLRPLKKDGSWDKKRKTGYILDADGNKIPEIDPATGEQKVRIRPGKGTEKLWKRGDVPTVDWNTHAALNRWRAEWARVCNEYLYEKEINAAIDHRSNKDRGIDEVPQIHEGHAAREMERKGKVSERCEYNRQVMKSRQLSKELAEVQKQIKNTMQQIIQQLLNGLKQVIKQKEQRQEENEAIFGVLWEFDRNKSVKASETLRMASESARKGSEPIHAKKEQQEAENQKGWLDSKIKSTETLRDVIQEEKVKKNEQQHDPKKQKYTSQQHLL